VSSCTCAVVAAGSQGRVHAQGYAAAGARLVAMADPDRAAARELTRDLGIPGVYGSHDELLAVEHPQALSICTPPAMHLEIARAAVAAGVRAIHCEKPIATSYADVLEMHRLAWDAGVQLTVNLQRRFEPVHAALAGAARWARRRPARGTREREHACSREQGGSR
jgi:UDP-N-acetylglucosamine 3-dehydrogenase